MLMSWPWTWLSYCITYKNTNKRLKYKSWLWPLIWKTLTHTHTVHPQFMYWYLDTFLLHTEGKFSKSKHHTQSPSLPLSEQHRVILGVTFSETATIADITFLTLSPQWLMFVSQWHNWYHQWTSASPSCIAPWDDSFCLWHRKRSDARLVEDVLCEFCESTR